MKPFDRGQRGALLPVGVLGGFDGVERVQHPEVEWHRQQRVRHRPVLAHDRVLVAPEGRQPMLDEAIQRPFGFGRRDGEQPRAVVADQARQVHAVEVVADLLVDVVFPRLVWLRDFKRRLLFRRRFAVVFVVVPSVADRFVAVHQHVEAAPLVAVEVLHAEAACARLPTRRSPCGTARRWVSAGCRRRDPAVRRRWTNRSAACEVGSYTSTGRPYRSSASE